MISPPSMPPPERSGSTSTCTTRTRSPASSPSLPGSSSLPLPSSFPPGLASSYVCVFVSWTCSARKADRLPTFRERQHTQLRKQAEQQQQQDAATKGKQKVDDDNQGTDNDHASDKADENVEAEAKAKALEAEEESAGVWKREGAGGGIVWTGSWDREVGLINVDDLIMASQAAAGDAGGAAAATTTARAKRHGVYAPTAFLPASSLPAHLGFVGRH